jgi:hypothetical protein
MAQSATFGFDAAGRQTLRIDARSNRTTYAFAAIFKIDVSGRTQIDLRFWYNGLRAAMLSHGRATSVLGSRGISTSEKQ